MSATPPKATSNPANPAPKRVTEATRVPMSVPQLRLELPEIPGYHTHWFLGRNVPRALKAGYEFLSEDDADVVQKGIANDREESGSTDMGSRVSTFAGGLVEGTAEPERLYAMKLRREWRDRDIAAFEAVNERVAAALRGGQNVNRAGAPAETADDVRRRYMKAGQDLFWPKRKA